MPVLHAVEGIGKLKILQIGYPGYIHLYDGWLEGEKHKTASLLYILLNILEATVPQIQNIVNDSITKNPLVDDCAKVNQDCANTKPEKYFIMNNSKICNKEEGYVLR